MGIRAHYPSPNRRGIRGGLGAAIAVALLAGSTVALTGVAAHADTGTPPVITDPEAIASAQAQTTGKSVPVDADTTATSTTVANPDGSFTSSASPVPVRVKQSGSWVALDATLQANADGTLSPKAASSTVAFSSGGSSPLATLTDPQGRQVSVSWPSALPAPTVSGSTATYAGVYPGVDLQMTATTDGGYTEHLIVKTATAAANPALEDIHLNTTASAGLTLSRNTAGGLQATDADGLPVFTSPTATMWSTGSQTSGSGGAQTQSLSAPTSSPSTSTASKDDTSPVTDLGVTVSSNGVDLVPPAGALTASTNTYPLVIDPSLAPAENGWTWVAQNTPGTSYWQGSNNTHDTNAHVGYDDWCSDGTSGCSAFGVTRSMFSFSMGALAGKHVTGATLTLDEQGPTSSLSGSKQIDLYGGGGITSGTTWNNQSVWPNVSASANFASITTNTLGSANFDVTSLVQNAITQGYGAQTMVLEAHSESDDTAYRYLIGSATATGHPDLNVTYWSTPNLPTSLSITNTGATTACNTVAPGTWINNNDSKLVNLNASLTGPDTGYAEDAQFWYQKIGDPSWTNLGGPTITANTTPQQVSATTPALGDGGAYQWQVYARSDSGTYSSAAAPAGASCYFRTDFTVPTATPGTPNAPTSTTSGSNTGTLSVTLADGGTNPSGVAKILYNNNGTSLDSGGDGEQQPSATAGSNTIPLKAEHWGTNTVWYAVKDAAGNESTPQHFDYYVADGAYTPGTAGDLTGDAKPDIAAIDNTGAIRDYSNPFVTSPNGTTGNTPGGAVMIPASKAPNGSSFSGALIGHAGSYSGQTCDDLVVVQGASASIDTDNNNCNPNTQWTQYPQSRPGNASTDYNGTDWSSVQQIAVLPHTATTSKPALLTVENYNGHWTLWMFGGTTDRITSATLLSTSSYWSHVTLISPGLINGTPALWVRDTTTGALVQFPGIETWSNNTAPSGTTFAASGYRVGQYPSITSDGPEDGANPTLWATTKTGQLTEIPTTVDAGGNVTVNAPVPVSAIGWAGNVQSLEGVKPIHPTSTIGLYRSSATQFIFDSANNSTTVDHTLTLSFAQAGDIPVTGDWSGTGVTGVGVYRPSNSTFYLDNSNTVSEIDHTISLGSSGDSPVVGDWDGDGVTTVGVYRPSNQHFYLDDSLNSSNVDHVVWYGTTGDQPIVGDWNNTGLTSIGVYRPSTRQFIPATSVDDNTAEPALAFGNSGDTALTGDWNGDGTTTIGTWRPSSFYLDNSLTVANADQTTPFGIGTDTPITGDWNGQ